MSSETNQWIQKQIKGYRNKSIAAEANQWLQKKKPHNIGNSSRTQSQVSDHSDDLTGELLASCTG